MTDKATSDLWWKNGMIYCVDVATWLDSDGDGTGDIAGLARRLDYLSGLGISTLWVMPFYPSPLGDDSYDITDYYAVDPRLGTLGDFVEMIRTASNLGIRVLVDLVLSHTSNQRPAPSPTPAGQPASPHWQPSSTSPSPHRKPRGSRSPTGSVQPERSNQLVIEGLCDRLPSSTPEAPAGMAAAWRMAVPLPQAQMALQWR
jgi:glycosidase